jgi:hypothetical protein
MPASAVSTFETAPRSFLPNIYIVFFNLKLKNKSTMISSTAALLQLVPKSSFSILGEVPMAFPLSFFLL